MTTTTIPAATFDGQQIRVGQTGDEIEATPEGEMVGAKFDANPDLVPGDQVTIWSSDDEPFDAIVALVDDEGVWFDTNLRQYTESCE